MIKREELTNPKSCMSRANDDEMTFVLLGRDKCAPDTIRAWVRMRVEMGKNTYADGQISEALECARRMEQAAAPSPASSPGKDAAEGMCKSHHWPPERKPHTKRGSCIDWTAEKPEGERLGTCATDDNPHYHHSSCFKWQPIAPEAAGGEDPVFSLMSETMLKAHPLMKAPASAAGGEGFTPQTNQQTWKAPAAPSEEQTKLTNAHGFYSEWSNLIDRTGAKMQDWPFRFAEAYAEFYSSTLRRERDHPSGEQSLEIKAHQWLNDYYKREWQTDILNFGDDHCIGEDVATLCQFMAKFANAELTARRRERDQLKGEKELWEREYQEVASTIERLTEKNQHDTRTILDQVKTIERLRKNLEYYGEHLDECALMGQTMVVDAKCSCECSCGWSDILREL